MINYYLSLRQQKTSKTLTKNELKKVVDKQLGGW